MPDFRVFCRPESADPRELLLSVDESHHLVVVNRARVGDPVVAFNGYGREWTCVLREARKQGARLEVRSSRLAPPLPYTLALAQALPKGGTMDAIVRKATELGAARIVPVASERTQVHLDEDRTDRKVGKWQTAALEAAKQCGNPWLPEIDPVRSLAEVLPLAAAFDLALIASLHSGARGLKSILVDHAARHGGKPPHRILWLIGPEGDFSPSEVEQAIAAGFCPVTLGPLVLRCETAAVYALSAVIHEVQG